MTTFNAANTRYKTDRLAKSIYNVERCNTVRLINEDERTVFACNRCCKSRGISKGCFTTYNDRRIYLTQGLITIRENYQKKHHGFPAPCQSSGISPPRERLPPACHRNRNKAPGQIEAEPV